MDEPTSHDASVASLVSEAREEVEAAPGALFVSALGGGMAIGFSFVAAAAAFAAAPPSVAPLAAAAVYPVGFLLVVGGRYQLFTENTLAPVAGVLERLTSLPRLLVMWTVILAGNFAGAAIMGAFLAMPGVLEAGIADAAPHVMSVAHASSATAVLGRALLAGWLVAGMVWLLHRMKTASPVLLIWSCTAMMPLLHLEHIVVGTVEAVYAASMGIRPVGELAGHLALTLVGNIGGGVLLVTCVNHARTRPVPTDERLTWGEWLLTFDSRQPLPGEPQ